MYFLGKQANILLIVNVHYWSTEDNSFSFFFKKFFFMNHLNTQIECKCIFQDDFILLISFSSGPCFIELVDILVTLLNVCFL